MRKYLKFLDPLLVVEQNHSLTGTFPEPQDVVSKIYRAHFKECDARKAEALILNEATDPLVHIKTLLFRGHLKEAEELAETTKKFCFDSKAQSELLLEQARLNLFKGDFQKTVEFAKSGLALDPVPMSKLGLYQILAAGHFELGEMDKASEALNKADSLRSLFSFCPTSVYSRINRAQIVARVQGVEVGKKMLQKIWEDLKNKKELTKDHVQALLRGEIDLARLSEENHYEAALASFLIADSMGEDLYSTLGLVDCLFSCPKELNDIFVKKLSEKLSRFARARRIVDEVDTGNPICTTSKAIVDFLRRQPESKSGTGDSQDFEYSSIVHFGSCVVVNLSKDRIEPFDNFPQLGLALKVLSSGSMTLEEFFHKIWGDQKYVSHMHEGLIWNIQQRIKTKLGVKIQITKSQISLSQVLFLGSKLR